MKVNEIFKKLIPPLSAEEYAQLEANILAEGIREPVILWNDWIVDGHNRHEIATKHGLECPSIYMDFDDENSAKEWMIRNQFGRRNLSNYQRSVLALELEHIFAEKAKENQLSTLKQNAVSQNSDKRSEPPIDTKKEVAKLADVSHDTIQRVKKIQAAAPPEIREKVERGQMSINEAYKEVRAVEKKEALSKERHIAAELGKQKTIDIDFRLGDFEDVFADIEDGSVDAIITDPPYPYEFIQCWSKLSRFAARVLKPGGYCLAYSGQMYLPEVMARMSDSLDYYWTFAVYHEGQTQIVNGVNLICRWKPVLVFQNGKQKISHTIQDYFVSEYREKSGHDWQQGESGVSYLVERFTKPGDLVIEPFAGSGTTIKACLKLGRQIKAAEIDETTYNIAKSSL